jgi:hypothetical protein
VWFHGSTSVSSLTVAGSGVCTLTFCQKMKHYLMFLVCGFTSFPAVAEEEAKKDVMTVEYRSVGQYPTHGVTMASALKALGITLDKIEYLKLVGDESSMTTGLSRAVKIDEWFWDRYFETAEPYKYWVSSGNRRLEVYLKGESTPKTTIYINETDSCTADGDPRDLRYMCHGLHRWFMSNLDSKPNKAEQGGAANPAKPGG